MGRAPASAARRRLSCDHRPMSDPDPERSSFEDVARALADEVSRAIERLSEIDLDEIARAASAEGERARQWIDELGRWLREQGDAWEPGPAPAIARRPGARPARIRCDTPGRIRSISPLPTRAGAGGTRLGPLEGRAGNERARRPRRGPRSQRRARARPRDASSRLDDRRRSDHAGRPRRAEPVARRRGSRLTDPAASSRPSARARRRAGAGSYGARRQVAVWR